MPNFKFVKAQFKNVWFIVLIFFLIFTLFVVLGTIFPTFSNSWVLNGQGELVFNAGGAVEFFNAYIFGILSFCLFWSLSVTLSTILLNKDISRGYVASWLTTPMSRTTIFNSKLFVILSSTLLVNIWISIFEMVIFSWRMGDFINIVENLLMGNLALMIFSFFVVSVIWFIFSSLPKPGIAIGISAGLITWFILCNILVQLSGVLANLKDLEYFKYFAIQTLLNSPLKFTNLPSLKDHLSELGPPWPDPTKTYDFQWNDQTQVLPIKVLDFAWQLPVMSIVATGFFTGSQFIIKNKDFSF